MLDIGCGRGDMVYHAVKSGCRKAVGIDYSSDAIKIAQKLRETLDQDSQRRMQFFEGDAYSITVREEFNYIFMIEVWEHMYDHQLIPLLTKIRSLLTKNGMLILTTPNAFYINFLYPLKRIMNIPFNLVKFPLRTLRGKWRPKSAEDFFQHVFKVKEFDDPDRDAMHINISTPIKIKKMLEHAGFSVKVECWDESKNILSLLLSRWAGREMLISAKREGA